MARFFREVGLDFSDVMIVPKKCIVTSRSEIDLSTKISCTRDFQNYIYLNHPLISANMSTVTDERMAMEMSRLGCAGFLHRYKKPQEIIDIIKRMKENNYHPIVPSIGVGNFWIPIVEQYLDAGADAICIDIAHGHSPAMISLLKQLVHFFPNEHFIAGNIVTADAARELVDAGATALKVGLGNGFVCSTRVETGAGIPQITAIKNIADAVRSSSTHVIADGGCRSAGDVVKALAAGAHAVMSGFLFAGSDETPTTGRYAGMASAECKKNWTNGTDHIEGTSMIVPDKGPVEKVVNHLLDGIRSGISYAGGTNIPDLHDVAEFISLK